MADQQSTLWFTESTDPSVQYYEIDVLYNGEIVGTSQVIDTDDSVDGYDEVSGEIEIRLGSITALPSDAQGDYTFHVYSVDSIGRSDLPLNVFNISVDFTESVSMLFPTLQDKRGVLLPNLTSPHFDSAHPNGDR